MSFFGQKLLVFRPPTNLKRIKVCVATMSKQQNISIRQAIGADAHHIAGLIQELADFEKYPQGPELSIETLAADLQREAFFTKLAFFGEQCAGMCLYYNAYSTWQGQVSKNTPQIGKI